MLRSLKDLESYTIAATDGDIGTVVDFLVDDDRWTVRYLVASTGHFFLGRRVLISPICFRQADWPTKSFHVQLTMDKVKHAPGIDGDPSVSRQYETKLSEYYAYAVYWTDHAVATGDRHLRSTDEVRGYRVQGSDEQLGHVEDFLIDDHAWEVKYFVVDTSWLSGERVLVAPHWATRISASERTVFLSETRDAVRGSPAWDPHAPIDRAYETRLHEHYGRSKRANVDPAATQS